MQSEQLMKYSEPYIIDFHITISQINVTIDSEVFVEMNQYVPTKRGSL